MESQSTYDIIVIGSGPGGYIAAIRAAQLGYKTAIVEKYKTLGGTCTNVGCIPAKALLDSTEHYHAAITKFKAHGIDINSMSLNFEQMINRKSEVVAQNVSGLNYLMKKNKIEVLQGTATFINNKEINIVNRETTNKVSAKWFIIATGSKPSSIKGVEIDKQRIITSTESLSLKEKPNSMVIIGGGVVGVEMASVFARIGVKVTILEYADSLIPTMDRDLGKELNKVLAKEGIDIQLSHKVQSAQNNGENVTVKYLDSKNNPNEITADYCLVAVGRKAYTVGLGLENTKIETDEQGRIKTNEKLQTAEENIYAIGDVIKGRC